MTSSRETTALRVLVETTLVAVTCTGDLLNGRCRPTRAKSTEKGAAIDPPGYDAGKKIKCKKRHVLVDAQGLLLHSLVHAGNIQDRDGGVCVMATLFGLHPFG